MRHGAGMPENAVNNLMGLKIFLCCLINYQHLSSNNPAKIKWIFHGFYPVLYLISHTAKNDYP